MSVGNYKIVKVYVHSNTKGSGDIHWEKGTGFVFPRVEKKLHKVSEGYVRIVSCISLYALHVKRIILERRLDWDSCV
jgi:hypothetical protein